MSNYNKVLLMGRLTRDPELRYTPQGTSVAEIGLATNREYMVGTEKRKETTFVDVTLWRRQAEVVCQFLKKGAPIFIEGHLTFDTWEAQDGQKRSKLRVVADNFQFIGGRQDGDSSRSYPTEEVPEGGDEGAGYSPSGRRAFPGRPSGPAGGPRTAPSASGEGKPAGRFSPPGAGRIPSDAFSPIPDGEGDETGRRGPRSSTPDDQDGPIGGVDERDIPF